MIIADSNVIMAFLLTRGITNQIISAHRDVFITPEHCYNEIWEHRDVWNKNNLSDEELKEIMEGVQQLFVYPVAEEVYKERMSLAKELINDPEDAPIVALALSIHNEGVWTYNTKHFLTEKVQSHITVLSTSDVLKKYPLLEEI
jgi:predicted nucleic acid-binding protein